MFVYREFKRENIVLQLVNTRRNEDLLRNVPHREFLDLAVIYHNLFNIDSSNSESILIDNSIMQGMNCSEDELYRLAYDNTRRKLPKVTIPLSQIFCWGYSHSQKDEMWLMSNEYLWHGASALLYKDELQDLADQLQANLHIFPSSVNEILIRAVSDKDDAESLRETVSDVNTYMLRENEILSENVYLYDRDSHKVSIV